MCCFWLQLIKTWPLTTHFIRLNVFEHMPQIPTIYLNRPLTAIKPLQNPCHWTPPPSWPILAIRPAAHAVPAAFLPPKKWSLLPVGTTVTVSGAACAASPWTRLPFVMGLMVKYIAGSAMVALGIFHGI